MDNQNLKFTYKPSTESDFSKINTHVLVLVPSFLRDLYLILVFVLLLFISCTSTNILSRIHQYTKSIIFFSKFLELVGVWWLVQEITIFQVHIEEKSRFELSDVSCRDFSQNSKYTGCMPRWWFNCNEEQYYII
jgi:hypothetical protein